MRDEPLALNDRGSAYGDGLFETVLVRDGHPLLWEEHLARLTRGCERLGFAAVPRRTLEAIFDTCGEGLVVVKVTVTRGAGGRGYRPPKAPDVQWRWSATPFTPRVDRWRAGVTVRQCRLALGIQPALAGIKHMARLENVMARREWCDDAVAEGLLCDTRGDLVEATAMNLIWQRGDTLETPMLDRCGVEGTLLCALESRLPIRRVRRDARVLEEARAVWVLNSVQGVWPVTTLLDADGRYLHRWDVPADDDLRRTAMALLGYTPSALV